MTSPLAARPVPARITPVERMETGYGFTLRDSKEAAAVTFIYSDEYRARQAAKHLQVALVDAAVMPADGL